MTSKQPAADLTLQSTARPVEAAVLLWGLARALLATMLWSSSAILIDRLTHVYHLTALEISFWRVLIVLPIIMLFTALYRPEAMRLRRDTVARYVFAGLVGVTLSYMSWAVSVRINGPAVAAALGFSAPAFVAIGDRLLFGTRLYRLQIAAIAATLFGCNLVAGIHSPTQLFQSPEGLLVGLSNGLAFSLYTLLGRGMARTGYHDPLTMLLYMFLFGTLTLLPWGVAAEGMKLFTLHLNATGWILLAGLALGPTLGAYGLFNSSLKDLPASVAAVAITLEPPMVAVLSYVVLGHTLHGLEWVGVALIVGGVLVMQLRVLTMAPRGESA
jgi:drug/metabolite transporter (DMT)-like permease